MQEFSVSEVRNFKICESVAAHRESGTKILELSPHRKSFVTICCISYSIICYYLCSRGGLWQDVKGWRMSEIVEHDYKDWMMRWEVNKTMIKVLLITHSSWNWITTYIYYGSTGQCLICCQLSLFAITCQLAGGNLTPSLSALIKIGRASVR